MSQKNHNSDKMTIELKSPVVQEVLGRPPRRIIRWGITVILFVIAGLFVGSYFFKYPDVVTAAIEVSAENLPVQLVARATGKIETLFITDNETVEKEQYLAVIENTANFEDVLRLKSELKEVKKTTLNAQPSVIVSRITPSLWARPAISRNLILNAATRNPKLGDLQPFYHQFIKSGEDYDYFIKTDYYNQKINALHRQVALQQQLQQRTRKQCDLTREQLATQERIFAADSILCHQKAIALMEYENARKTLLQMHQTYQSALASIDNIELTIAQYEQNIFDLQQQETEKNKEFLLSLTGAYDALQSQIEQWELQYIFKSPIAGKISMPKSWQKNRHINAGELFLNIVPEATTRITGKIMLPAQGAGKVKIGQTVNVKFDGYPHIEFGMVKGKVKNIALVPVAIQQDKFTVVEVEFPDNLATNYGKTLDFSQEMSGSADIITEDLRLIERFFNPVKALMKR